MNRSCYFSLGWFPAMCAAILLSAGCESSGGKGPNIPKPSETGEKQFLNACAAYQEIEMSGLGGQRRQEALSARVLRPLSAAQTNDPKCPLYATKLADILLEISPSNSDQASKIYEDTLKTNGQDWPPAWIGLAQVALLKGDVKRAADCVLSARSAVESLHNGYNRAFSGRNREIRFLGITLNPEPSKNVDDPKLTEQQRYELTLVFLRVRDLWSLLSGSIYSQWGAAASTLSPQQTFDRLRAEVELMRIRCMRVGGESAEKILAAFSSEETQWDPNYIPARLENAELFLSLGRYSQADSLINSYVTSENPAIGSNPQILLFAANLYHQWYMHPGSLSQEQRTSAFDNGEEVLIRILRRLPTQPRATYLLAKHLTEGGLVENRIDVVEDARQKLNSIKDTNGGVGAAEIKAQQQRIEAVLAEMRNRKVKP